jgi:hypothetical protein
LSDDRLLSALCDDLSRAGFAAVAGAGRGEVQVLLPEGEDSPLAAVLFEELLRWQEQHETARIKLEP